MKIALPSLKIRESPKRNTMTFHEKYIACLILGLILSVVLFCNGCASTVGRNPEKGVSGAAQINRGSAPGPVMGIPTTAAVPLREIAEQVSTCAIVYVGEVHNHYGDHIVQLELIKSLRKKSPRLAIGMEIFEQRYQAVLDRYINGTIDEESLLRESHYFTTWGFNYNLYREILLYARAQRIPVIALNANPDLVHNVACNGLSNLSNEDKALIPKQMDLSDEHYKERLRKVFDSHQTDPHDNCATRQFDGFFEAQVLWDETMAQNIAAFLDRHKGYQMVVLAGNGHLAYGSGIPKRTFARNKLDFAVILPGPNGPLEPDLADFIMFSPDAEAPPEPRLMINIETNEKGMIVENIVPGSSAATVGLKIGDVIRAVNAKAVSGIDGLRAILFSKQVGDQVIVTVERNDQTISLSIELEGFRMPHPRMPVPASPFSDRTGQSPSVPALK